jgi:hypothetical protein
MQTECDDVSFPFNKCWIVPFVNRRWSRYMDNKNVRQLTSLIPAVASPWHDLRRVLLHQWDFLSGKRDCILVEWISVH